MVFQVIDVSLFDENTAKKNIKGRVQLSDGVSKIVTMVSDKAFHAMVVAGGVLEKWSIWSLNVSR